MTDFCQSMIEMELIVVNQWVNSLSCQTYQLEKNKKILQAIHGFSDLYYPFAGFYSKILPQQSQQIVGGITLREAFPQTQLSRADWRLLFLVSKFSNSFPTLEKFPVLDAESWFLFIETDRQRRILGFVTPWVPLFYFFQYLCRIYAACWIHFRFGVQN